MGCGVSIEVYEAQRARADREIIRAQVAERNFEIEKQNYRITIARFEVYVQGLTDQAASHFPSHGQSTSTLTLLREAPQ